MAGRKEPPEWLRDGLDLDHPGPWSLVRLPYGNRAIFHGCRKFPHHLRSASLSQEKSSLFYPPCGGPVAGGPGGPASALCMTLIGSIDPYALKIPARRAERSFTRFHPEVATRRHSALAAWPPWSRQNGPIGHRLQHTSPKCLLITCPCSREKSKSFASSPKAKIPKPPMGISER